MLETRHVRDAFKAMPVKTDRNDAHRNDARGIAHLMRLGWFPPVHCKVTVASATPLRRGPPGARFRAQAECGVRSGDYIGRAPRIHGWR